MRKHQSAASLKGHKKESKSSREQKRLKSLEKGFNTWNPETLQEYNPFEDGNMRTYFTTRTVRKVLMDKGIIKSVSSPDGKLTKYIVNDNCPKNIFFTKKTPEEVAASKPHKLPPMKRTSTPVLSLDHSEMVETIFTKLIESMNRKMAKPIEIFRLMDDDESGHITYKELRVGLMDTLGLKLTDDEFNSLVAVIDRDGGGDIQYEELSKQLKAFRPKRAMKKSASAPVTKQAEDHASESTSPSAETKNKSVAERTKELELSAKNPEVMKQFAAEMEATAKSAVPGKPSVHINLAASSGKQSKKQQNKGMMASYLKPDSVMAKLYAKDKRKATFAIGTYGEIARRERARKEARRYKKKGSTRPGVPTQEKSPRTPREIVAHRRMLASMSNKIEMAVEKLDDVLAEEDRKPADYFEKEQARMLRNLRNHVDMEFLHDAVKPYVGDFFGTRGDYFDGQMYMSRMTVAKEHKSKNPWDKIAETDSYDFVPSDSIPGLPAKRTCAVALCNISYDEENRASLADEGCTSALVDLSIIHDPTIRLNCAIAFNNLSRLKSIREGMIDNGAIPALLHLLSADVEDKLTMLHSMYAICNLSCVPNTEEFMMQNGVLTAAAVVAKSDDQSLVEPALTILYNLTVTHGNVYDDSEKLVQDIIHLAMLISSREDFGDGVKRYSYIFARALCNLTRTVRLRARMITEGIVLAFTPLLHLGDEVVSRLCIIGITNLSQATGELRRTCIRHGAIDILMSVCKGQSNSQENRERGIVALSNLCRNSKDTETTQRILPIILSLSQAEDEESWLRCTTALMSLSNAKNNRFILVKSEAVQVVIHILTDQQKKYSQTSAIESNCVQFLCNLLQDQRCRKHALEKSSVPSLLLSLRTQQEYIMETISSILYVLSGDYKSRQAISNEETMIAFLAMAQLGGPQTKARASAVLSVLAETGSTRSSMVRLADKVFPVLNDLLQADGTETRRYAVICLTYLAEVSTTHLRISQDCVNSLVPLASSNDKETKIWLCALLCKLSFSEDAATNMCLSRACLAISLLSRMDDVDTEMRCSVTLCNLSAFSACRSRMMQDKAVVTTLALSASHFEATRLNCVKVICNLACTPEAEGELMRQNVLPELMIISLVRANTAQTKVACAAAMVNMLVEGTASEMVREGLIWCLTQLAALPSELLVKAAASAFATIVETDDSRKTLIASDKGINSLMSLMRTESRKTRELCWQTFGRICLENCQMRLVEEGVLSVLTELVAGDDYMLKRNSGAILALLTADASTRTTIVHDSMKLLVALSSDSGNEPARQYCADAIYALSKDKKTREQIVNKGVDTIFSSLLRVSESSHTDTLCLHSIYNVVKTKEGAKVLCIPTLIDLLKKLNESHDAASGDLLMATIRSVSWGSSEACCELVSSGIITSMATIMEDADKSGSQSEEMRRDCAVACRNFSQRCTERLENLVDDGILKLLFIVINHEKLEVKRYVAQSLCYLSTMENNRDQMIDMKCVKLLVSLLHAGSLPLQRESMCTLHYLALDESNMDVLLAEGVYDAATRLGSHSDKKIKRSCESILQLLSDAVKNVGQGTVSRFIALCMKQTEHGHDPKMPLPPADACYEVIDRDTWEETMELFDESSNALKNAIIPAMVPLPFSEMGTEFKAPEWDRISWPICPKQPAMPPAPALSADQFPTTIRSAGNGSSDQSSESVLEGNELPKGEPKNPQEWNNVALSQKFDSIITILEKSKPPMKLMKEKMPAEEKAQLQG